MMKLKTSDSIQNDNLFEIPDQMTQFIESQLQRLGTSLDKSEFLAKHVQMLSDFYIDNPKATTPDFSRNAWAEIATLAYYFPLNYLRNLKVFTEAHRLGFLNELDSVVEFGAGLGPSSWSLKNFTTQKSIASFYWIEKNSAAKYYTDSFSKIFANTKADVFNKYDKSFFPSSFSYKNSLLTFSYSLTELKEIPDWANEFEALAIIEPSTQEDGRKLQELRTELLKQGYSIWGPCLHELECPLLKHSKKDWCHDRLFFQRPQWLIKIESLLPWENRTLTLSYLLARKKIPSWKKASTSSKHRARIIGDTLYEKGKTRQLICQNDERLFLSWLNKKSVAPEIPRGSLVGWNNHEQKANEIRPSDLELIHVAHS